MLLGLHMIVKDEAQRIRQTLESVRDHIDWWSILDTGSTDGTQAIIREVLADVPGELHEEPVRTYSDTGLLDYAETRNRGLELAGDVATFLLLLNGDDTLVGGEHLRAFCQANQDGQHGAYTLRVVPEQGAVYDSARLARTAASWRYHLPTHEVLSGPGGYGPRVGGATIGHEEDPIDKRMARWARDKIVLSRWLDERPGDARATFYLAQTHECLGELEQAAQRYQERAKLPGFYEEAYESLRRAAGCLDRSGASWPVAQDLYLRAHAMLPHRMEALYAIAKHWADLDNHALAYLFAQRGADTPEPVGDLLMVDRDVYNVGMADLSATHGYYLGGDVREPSRRAAIKAAAARPHDHRLRRNLHFYARPLSTLVDGYREVSLDVPAGEGWSCCNPSVCSNGLGELAAIVRTVNYRINAQGGYDYPGGAPRIRTRNWFCWLNQDYTIRHGVVMGDPRPERPDAVIGGLEDCRLFWAGRWMASCTVADESPDMRREMALVTIEDGAAVNVEVLRGPWSKQHQKNWRPIVHQNADLHPGWVYSTAPLVLTDGRTVPVDVPPFDGRLCGSSQVVQMPDGRHLWIDHEVSTNAHGGQRFYVHRFVTADCGLERVEHVGHPWVLHGLGIEFVAGLALDGDQALISFGLRDAEARMAVIPLSEVLRAEAL